MRAEFEQEAKKMKRSAMGIALGLWLLQFLAWALVIGGIACAVVWVVQQIKGGG